MASTSFVHLHNHSHYSLLDGLSRIPEMVAAAKKDGQPAVALTDHGALYGAVEFYQAARKAGVKPIIGVEAYYAPDGRRKRTQAGEKRTHHLILLAKNATGYKNLLTLVSAAHLEGFYYKPRMDWEILDRYGEGLIVLTACLGGELAQAILSGKPGDDAAIVQRFQGRFRDDFYLEVQHRTNTPEQRVVNERLVALCAQFGVPIVATNDCHYLTASDAEAQDVLLCMQTKAKQEDVGRLSMLGENYSFRTAKEMRLAFEDHPEACDTTLAIAERCNVELELGSIHLPSYPIPADSTYDSELSKRCEAGFSARYGSATPQRQAEARERLRHELGIITEMGYSSYFLIVADFVGWAKERGIVVGPGRGSAAGSIVAYLCSITNLDPLAYDLLFERFLTPGRIQMPDIDLDFADHRRDEVLDYVRGKYGEDHVAQIITFGTMAARAAIRDVGRVLDVPYTFCDRLAKLIPFGATLAEAERKEPELAALLEADETTRRIFAIAKRVEGAVRHTSTHACGVVISARPLVEHLPIQRASADDATIITQYEMHAVEDLGLLKMDFLGLSNLSIIEHAVSILRDRGVDLDIEQIPLDDAATYALLQRGDTTGVFQLECLSGDTLVSNRTIAQLYELQRSGKPCTGLRSVYLDTGTLHNNRVLAVQRSGKKKMFRLTTEDGRTIKASADHQFMTSHGWKRLSDLVSGTDAVLTKPRAKYVVLHTCQGCGVEREVESGNLRKHAGCCYRCSTKYFKNPAKPQSRERIVAARRAFYAAGGKPWNMGLTTETNAILRANGEKIRRALAGRSLEDRVGVEWAAEVRRKLSERSTGSNNPMFGKKAPHRKGGFRADLGHYVRSNWEADFARILMLYDIAYEYEPQTFTLRRRNGEVCSYTPDFYTPHDRTFYEVKGWMHDLDAEKIALFQEQYPMYGFVLINTTKFAELAMQYQDLVAWECPVMPDQLAFARVRAIVPLGVEETYDIVMMPPGNNFIANGFVVHNSGGMKRYLKDLTPTEFEDIIAMVSLYRPGPMELIPEFIDRKFGRKPVTYLHPKLEPILKNTYGIMVYQEQLMRLARDLAGFTLSEADTLRKAVGKKIKKLLDEQRQKLVDGMIAQGIHEKIAKNIWAWVEPFARYGFNRSHGACYALIAYQTAYLKANYPAEFMCALLTAERGNTDRLAVLIQECREMNIPVLGPDLNASEAHFSVVRDDGGGVRRGRSADRVVLGAIRFGLAAVKNVGEGVVAALVAERKTHGAFLHLEDILSRIQDKDFNKKSLESLIRCGAFDAFGERGQLLGNMDGMLAFNRDVGHDRISGQENLFGTVGVRVAFALRSADPVPQRLMLAWEKELLGLYLSAHPFAASAAVFGDAVATIAACKDASVHDGASVLFGGVITRTKRIVTKKGDPMLFAEVEDHTASMEVVVFPRVLEANPQAWMDATTVLVRGKRSDKDGTPKVLVDRAVQVLPGRERDALEQCGVQAGRLEEPLPLVLQLPHAFPEEQLVVLRGLLAKFPGPMPVRLRSATGHVIATGMHVALASDLRDALDQMLGAGAVLDTVACGILNAQSAT